MLDAFLMWFIRPLAEFLGGLAVIFGFFLFCMMVYLLIIFYQVLKNKLLNLFQ